MNKTLLAAIATALSIASTGTAHATEYYQCGGDKLVYAPYLGSDSPIQWVDGSLLYHGEKCQSLIFVVRPPDPFDDRDRDLGDAYDCPGISAYDEVFTKREHVASDTNRMIITIQSTTNSVRRENGKRVPYPVVQYNMKTDKLTVNGKRCREAKDGTR